MGYNNRGAHPSNVKRIMFHAKDERPHPYEWLCKTVDYFHLKEGDKIYGTSFVYKGYTPDGMAQEFYDTTLNYSIYV